MTTFQQQAIKRVFNLSPGVSRALDEHVEDPETPYAYPSEFVELAIRNQLEMDRDGTGAWSSWDGPDSARSQFIADVSPGHADVAGTQPHAALLRMAGAPGDVAELPRPDEFLPLSFLPNRANPMPVVVRVIANMGRPRYEDAIEVVGSEAREVGLRLKAEDENRGVKGSAKRSVSWPVGEDPAKSIGKFVDSYLMWSDGSGGLRDFALARLQDGHVVLTRFGADLAALPTPLLGETEDGLTVGAEARRLLQDALLANPAEVREMRTFFGAIDSRAAVQGEVDRALHEAHEDWTDAHVVSHRAAMVGRLRDLEVLTVNGRGPSATLEFLPGGELLVQKVMTRL